MPTKKKEAGITPCLFSFVLKIVKSMVYDLQFFLVKIDAFFYLIKSFDRIVVKIDLFCELIKPVLNQCNRCIVLFVG